MRRYKSPQTAARLAERDARKAEARRKGRRTMVLKLAGILALMITVAVADFIWLQSRMRRRLEHRRQIQHTNTIKSSVDQTNQQIEMNRGGLTLN